MKRHLRESKMKVSELDFEPTLKAVEKIADRLGLKWDNVRQGTIEQRGDYTFTVKDIPNHGINQFSVHKSDDGQSLIVSVPDTAKMDVALEGKKPLTFAQTGYVKEAKRMQEMAGLVAEAEEAKSAAIASKIDQNLDKVQDLPVIQKTAEKIANDPKLLQQFQQGLSKMGIDMDMLKEDAEAVDVSDLTKIVQAIQAKEKQIKETLSEDDDFLAIRGAEERERETKGNLDDTGGAILRGFFGIPILAAAFDQFVSTDIINLLGGGIQGGLVAAGVGAFIGGIIGAIAYKKRKAQQKPNLETRLAERRQARAQITRMQELAGLTTETIGSSRAYLNPHRAADLIADEFGEELTALMKDVNGTLGSTPSFEKTALGYLRAKMDAKDYMSFRNDPDEPSDYISTLVQNLNGRGNDSDLYPGTMGDEMSAPTSI